MQSADNQSSSRNIPNRMLPVRTRTPLEHRSHRSNEPNSSVSRFVQKEKPTPREGEKQEAANNLITRLKANVYAFPEKEALEQKRSAHQQEEQEKEKEKPVVEQFMYDQMKIPIEKIHQAIDDRLTYLCKRTTYKSHRIGSLMKLRNQSIQNMNQMSKQSQLQ
uniref:Uncharacterized protein n=1 Tax=Strombidium inclinatum TaxID=197538 RepID=A0A7S3ISY3_9SPIT|mmetsp:Transcript_3592/g.5428  ORF Transcript_3592/g.5428 Transcript_3592/m.5428 type:complete len:163 (+) Transcript_3592:819-1307(+)